MRHFDDVMADVAQNLPADLLLELQELIEAEGVEMYDVGYNEGCFGSRDV
jgi:hypothetical protein